MVTTEQFLVARLITKIQFFEQRVSQFESEILSRPGPQNGQKLSSSQYEGQGIEICCKLLFNIRTPNLHGNFLSREQVSPIDTGNGSLSHRVLKIEVAKGLLPVSLRLALDCGLNLVLRDLLSDVIHHLLELITIGNR